MKFDCEQLAGFAQMEFFLLEETSNWPLVLTDQNASQVSITPLDNNVDAEIVEDSINIDINPKKTVDGTIYPVNASFKINTRSESLEQLLEQYENKPGIFIGDLNTGFRKMYGSNEEPLYLNYQIEEGQKPGDNSGTIVIIKGETRSRPVFYTVTD